MPYANLEIQRQQVYLSPRHRDACGISICYLTSRLRDMLMPKGPGSIHDSRNPDLWSTYPVSVVYQRLDTMRKGQHLRPYGAGRSW